MADKLILEDVLLTQPGLNGGSHISHLENKIRNEAGGKVLKLINAYVDVNQNHTQVFSTSTVFNIEKFEKKDISSVVNLKRINDLRSAQLHS